MNGERKLIIKDLQTRVFGDIKYVPYPATYLNNDGWLDNAEQKTKMVIHNAI